MKSNERGLVGQQQEFQAEHSVISEGREVAGATRGDYNLA